MHPDVTRQQPAAEVTQGEPLPRHVRLLVRMARRQLPAPVCRVSVERGIAVPASDGMTLLTDHYRPLAPAPHPTLLVRTPYGRGFPWDYLYGALLGEQGFHVVLHSCRGTGGPQGRSEPCAAEAADARATIAWLRRQEWFDGSLATIWALYLWVTHT